MTPPRRNEIELLLACARRDMQPADIERASRASTAGLDWALVERAARAHGLLPLLQRHVAGGVIDAPRPARIALADRARRIALRNMERAATLASLLDAFARASVFAVPLKGPVLAERLYGSIALRRFVDLDLLVRPAQFDEAARLLESRGFRSEPILPAGFEGLAASLSHHLPFTQPRSGHRIELHRYLIPPKAGRAIGLDTFGFRFTPVRFMGVDTVEFAAEDLLVYLTQHGSVHAWDRMEWLAGIAELLRSGAILDEARVDDVARALGERRRVEAARALARHLFDGAAVPDGRAARAASLVLRRLARDPAGRASWLDGVRYGFLSDDTRADRARRAAIAMLRPSEEDIRLVRLPRPLWPLYGVVRLARLAGRNLSRAATLVSGK